MAGALLGSRYGTAVVAAYVAQGLIGLPVFAGWKGGITALFGQLAATYWALYLPHSLSAGCLSEVGIGNLAQSSQPLSSGTQPFTPLGCLGSPSSWAGSKYCKWGSCLSCPVIFEVDGSGFGYPKFIALNPQVGSNDGAGFRKERFRQRQRHSTILLCRPSVL